MNDEQEQQFIGTATAQPDGTLELRLIAKADDGMHGEAMIVVSPTEERYARIVDHLGGIQPGQTKPVPAWNAPPSS
jgi:hypothetical protein